MIHKLTSLASIFKARVVLLCSIAFKVELQPDWANEFNAERAHIGSLAEAGRVSARILLLLLLASMFTWRTEATLAYAPNQADDCTIAPPAADPTSTVCVSNVIVNADVESPDNHFSVSWISKSAEGGQVLVVDGDTFDDIRGPDFSGITHYVQVSNLTADTVYEFDISSGGQIYTNNGHHWALDIGPALPPASPFPIVGRVKSSSGGDATQALVYARVQQASGSATSSLLSMSPPLTDDDQGFFHNINLSDSRSVDADSNYDGRFSFDQNRDKVVITAVGRAGFASVTVKASIARPRPGGVNVILTLGSGFVTYSTPTPTPIQPTSTPTQITPVATPTSLPLTATALAATETAAVFATAPSSTQIPPSPITRAPIIPPTATAALITIVPAEGTLVAEATVQNPPAVTPETQITRSVRATSTPAASSALGGIFSNGSLFAVLAAGAFVGAALLGVGAFYVWKR
jgi:hypothetical protein